MIRRRQDENWLNLTLRLERACLLGGLKGSGKTTLARALADFSKTQIYNFNSFVSFASSLGHPELSPEQALQMESKTWKADSLIIWDDIHCLTKLTRGLLFEEIKRPSGQCKHILLTEEDLQFESGLSLRVLEPWTEDDLAKLLLELDIEVTTEELHKIYQASGGLPGLALLQILNPQGPHQQGTLHITLNEAEKNVIALEILIPQLFSRFFDSLRANLESFKKIELGLTSLQTRFLARSTATGFEFNSLLVDPATYKVSLNTLALDPHFLENLTQNLPLSNLEKFVIGLKAQHMAILENASAELSPDALEDCSAQDLKSLLNWMENFEKAKNDKAPYWLFLRLRLKIYILEGRRKEALELASRMLKSIQFEKDEGPHKLKFAFDAIYWLNRSGLSQSVEPVIAAALHRSQGPLKIYFQIEQAIPLYKDQPERALGHLQKIKTGLENSQGLLQQNSESELLLAQCLFEISIVLNRLERPDEASLHLQRAAEIFQKNQKPYFRSFCLLNLIFIFSAKKDWDSCALEIKNLKEILRKYNYEYLKAGVLFAEAWMHASRGEMAKAFEDLSEAQNLARRSGTLKALGDILSLKARLYHWMGLDSQAEPLLLEIKDKKLLTESGLRQLELEIQRDDLTLEEWLDRWGQLSTEFSDFYWYVYLSRGGSPEETRQETELHRSFISSLALTFQQLFQTLQLDNETEISRALIQIENKLTHYHDARPERAVVHLVRGLLHKSSLRLEFFEKSSFELLRWACDPTRKIALQALVESLQSETLADVFQLEAWRLLPVQEKERWRTLFNWVQKHTDQGFEYLENSLQGSRAINQIPQEFPPKCMIYIEPYHKIIKNKKTLANIQSRPVMRNTLSLILEVFPKSVSKATLASSVWGEPYDPRRHDSRIYTSIQRLRSEIGTHCILNWESGYRWNPEYPFFHYRSKHTKELGQHKVKSLILEIMRKMESQASQGVARSTLVEGTDSSDSTVKRILSELINEGLLVREGRGPSAKYFLKR